MTDLTAEPQVTIIVPCYNSEEFLQETVESVRAQTLASWELLLVQDGSTDQTAAIAEECAGMDPRIHVFYHPGRLNKGACASRNLALGRAKGKYVAFLDADDVWLPQKLNQQVELLRLHRQAVMIYGRARRWYSWSAESSGREDIIYDLGFPGDRLFAPPELARLCLQRRAPTPCPSDVMCHTSFVKEIGGFEEAFVGKYQHCEDQAFFYKVFLNGTVFAADSTWINYRQHEKSCCSRVKQSQDANLVRLFFLNWLEKYCATKGFSDPILNRALQREMRPFRHPHLTKMNAKAEGAVRAGRSVLGRAAKRLLPLRAVSWLKS